MKKGFHNSTSQNPLVMFMGSSGVYLKQNWLKWQYRTVLQINSLRDTRNWRTVTSEGSLLSKKWSFSKVSATTVPADGLVPSTLRAAALTATRQSNSLKHSSFIPTDFCQDMWCQIPKVSCLEGRSWLSSLHPSVTRFTNTPLEHDWILL